MTPLSSPIISRTSLDINTGAPGNRNEAKHGSNKQQQQRPREGHSSLTLPSASEAPLLLQVEPLAALPTALLAARIAPLPQSATSTPLRKGDSGTSIPTTAKATPAAQTQPSRRPVNRRATTKTNTMDHDSSSSINSSQLQHSAMSSGSGSGSGNHASNGGHSPQSHSNANANTKAKAQSRKQPKMRRQEEAEVQEEVDIARNPTVLCKLLIQQKFASAAKRLRRCPSEASTWLCCYPFSHHVSSDGAASIGQAMHPPDRRISWPVTTVECSCGVSDPVPAVVASPTRTSASPSARLLERSANFTFRQLPIHLACNYLHFIPKGIALREDLERLILYLVTYYPQACSQMDHTRQYPLWMAVQWNTTPAIVLRMIHAFPNALVDIPQRIQPNEAASKDVLWILKHASKYLHQSTQEAMLRFALKYSAERGNRSRANSMDESTISSGSTMATAASLHMPLLQTDTNTSVAALTAKIEDLLRSTMQEYDHDNSLSSLQTPPPPHHNKKHVVATNATAKSTSNHTRSMRRASASGISMTGEVTSIELPTTPTDTNLHNSLTSVNNNNNSNNNGMNYYHDTNNNSSSGSLAASFSHNNHLHQHQSHSHSHNQQQQQQHHNSHNHNGTKSNREVQLERLVSAMMDRNTLLSQAMEAQQFQSGQLLDLQDENSDLRKESLQLGMILRDYGHIPPAPIHTASDIIIDSHHRRPTTTIESTPCPTTTHTPTQLPASSTSSQTGAAAVAGTVAQTDAVFENGEERRQGDDDSGSDANGSGISSEDEAVGMMGMDPEKPTVLTRYLEGKVGILQQQNDLLFEENQAHMIKIQQLERKLSQMAPAVSQTSNGRAAAEGDESGMDSDENSDADRHDATDYFLPLSTNTKGPPNDLNTTGTTAADSVGSRPRNKQQLRLTSTSSVNSGGSSISRSQKDQERRRFLQKSSSVGSELSGDNLSIDTDGDQSSQVPHVETERERELTLQVQHLTRQLESIREQQSQQLQQGQHEQQQQQQHMQMQMHALSPPPPPSESPPTSSRQSYTDDESSTSQKLDLEARLRFVDKRTEASQGRRNGNRSGNHRSGRRRSRRLSSDRIDTNSGEYDYDDDASDATPQTRNSSLTGAEYSYQVQSRASTASRGDNSASASSWGLLSLTQKKKSQHRRPSKRATMSMLPTLEQGNNSFNSISFHDSLRSFADTVRHEMDNLDDICKAAAEFYDADRTDNLMMDGHKSASDLMLSNHSQRTQTMNRRFSDGGAPPALTVQKHVLNESFHGPEDVDPLIATAKILAAEEDLIAIVREAEHHLDQSLPRDLFIALRDVSLRLATEMSSLTPSQHARMASASDAPQLFHTVAEAIVNYKLIDEVERACNRSIPLSAVSALRTAAQRRLESTQKDLAMMETLKVRLKQEFFDALIEQAERQLHHALPQSLVESLRDAGGKFDSLLYELDDGGGGMRIDFKEVDRMLREAQQLYGDVFEQNTLISLRRALFVLQSRLEGNDSGHDPMSTSTGSYHSSSKADSYMTNGNASDGDSTTGSTSSSSELHGEIIEESGGETTATNTNEGSSRSSALKDHSKSPTISAYFAKRGNSHERHRSSRAGSVQTPREEVSEATSLAETKTSSADASLSLHNIFPGFDSSKGGESIGTISTSNHRGPTLDKIAETPGILGSMSPASPEDKLLPATSPSKSADRGKENVAETQQGDDVGADPSPPRPTRLAGTIMHSNPYNFDAPNLLEIPPQPDLRGIMPQVSDVPVVHSTSLHSIRYEPEISPEMAAEQNMEDEMSPELNAALMMLSKSSGLSASQSLRLDDDFTVDTMDDNQPPIDVSVVDGTHTLALGQQDQKPSKEEGQQQQQQQGGGGGNGLSRSLSQQSTEIKISFPLTDIIENPTEVQTGPNGRQQQRQKQQQQQQQQRLEREETRSQESGLPSSRGSHHYPEADDARSHDLSRVSRESELSLDIGGVFSPPKSEKPSQLEKDLSRLNERRPPSTGHSSLRAFPKVTSSSNRFIQRDGHASMDFTSTPFRRLGPSKSGNLENLAAAARDIPRRGRLRATKSDDLTSLAAFTKIVTDDLDVLLKKAAETEKSERGARTMQPVDDSAGEAAFEDIVTDTEATYGLEIPENMVESLREACLGSNNGGMTSLMVVRALHDDGVIQNAEQLFGGPMPADLLEAMRNVALPPGMSKQKLMGTESDDANAASNAYNEDPNIPMNAAPPGYLPKQDNDVPQKPASISKMGKLMEDADPLAHSSTRRIPNMRRPRKPSSSRRDKLMDALDLSIHSAKSDTSWDKLTNTRVSASEMKALRKKAESNNSNNSSSHGNGNGNGNGKKSSGKLERKKRASAERFMNSLADFGPPTDDLKDLFQNAVATLDHSTTKKKTRKSGDSKHSTAKPERKQNLESLMEVSESHEESTNSFPTGSYHNSTKQASSKSLNAAPSAPSPQAMELDLLLTEAQNRYSFPIPANVADALKKASWAKDKSVRRLELDSNESSNSNVNGAGQPFGTFLTSDRIEVLILKSVAMLRRSIPADLMAAIREAAQHLTESKVIVGGKQAATSDRNSTFPPKMQRSQTEPIHQTDFAMGFEPQDTKEQKIPASPVQRYNAAALVTPKRTKRYLNINAKIAKATGRADDMLLNVASGTKTDDLSEMYKAAYLESPRPQTNGGTLKTSSPPPPPSYKSPKQNGAPIRVVSTPTRSELMERTESGRFSLELSPMTACTLATDGGSLKEKDMQDVMDASKARLGALVNDVPNEGERADQGGDRTAPAESSVQADIAAGVESVMYENDDKQAAGNETADADGDANMKIDGEYAPGTFSIEGAPRIPTADEMRGSSSPELPELESLSGPADSTSGDEMHDSKNASAELDAIIAETQEQFGMELPNELIEALKRASIHTLLSETDAMNMSGLSSLMMEALNLDEEDNDGKSLVSDSNDIVSALCNKLSSASSASAATSHAASAAPASAPAPASASSDAVKVEAEPTEEGAKETLTPPSETKNIDPQTLSNQDQHQDQTTAEYDESFLAFITTAEHEYGQKISGEIAGALRSATQKDGEHDINCLHETMITSTMAKASGSLGIDMPTKLTRSFRIAARSFRGLTLSEHFKKQHRSGEDTISYGNASGYFSALSESYISEPDLDDDELRMQYIIDEAKELNGDVPEDFVKTLGQVNTGPDGAAGTVGELETSDSELDYSASTFASFSLSPKGPKADQQPWSIPEREKALELQYMDDRANQPGGEGGGGSSSGILPSDVLAPLNDTLNVQEPANQDTAGANANVNVINGMEKVRLDNDDGKRSSRIAFAYNRESSGHFSEISTDSELEDPKSSELQWTAGSNGDRHQESSMAKGSVASGGQTQEQAPPPPPPMMGGQGSAPSTPQSLAPNKQLGPSILCLLRKTYAEKVPRELCYVLSRSTALSYAMNTDDEIDIILRECAEMTGNQLSADLVVALREASVANRNMDSSTRSRRSRLIRQSSGSFRSSSRSSAMPSIQENSTADGKKRERGNIIEVERIDSISFSPAATRGGDKNRDGTSVTSGDDGTDAQSTTSSITFETKLSLESFTLDDLQTPKTKPLSDRMIESNGTGSDRGTSTPSSGPGQGSGMSPLENSISTIQMSNIGGNNKWRASPSSNGSSTASGLAKNSEMRVQMDLPIHEMTLDLDETDEQFSRDACSRASSSSTETSFSTSKMSNISRASTLPSKTAVLGVNTTLPLEGLESDDLSTIFKEAARRMSR